MKVKKMQIETKRLLLREMNQQDFSALFNIFSDPETMKHYPAPFDKKRVKDWIEWNIQNYRNYGFGLWSVVLKETGQVIGDCGITIQNINGDLLPEIGYHVHKNYWKRGYGSEAAKAVRDYAFQNTDYEILYSYVKYTNLASFSTAQKIGMKKINEFPNKKNKISYVYALTRSEWLDHQELPFRTAKEHSDPSYQKVSSASKSELD